MAERNGELSKKPERTNEARSTRGRTPAQNSAKTGGDAGGKTPRKQLNARADNAGAHQGDTGVPTEKPNRGPANAGRTTREDAPKKPPAIGGTAQTMKGLDKAKRAFGGDKKGSNGGQATLGAKNPNDSKNGKGNDDNKKPTDKKDQNGLKKGLAAASAGTGAPVGSAKADASKGSGAASGADAAKSRAKKDLRGANATGVDYSDKGLKDQLEHQAADLAMDATPVLGQINSARKALKQANKQKRDAKEASGNHDKDGLDSLEDGADKVVDGGIKGAKAVLGTAAAGTGAAGIGAGILATKAFLFLKGFAGGLIGKTVGFFGSILQTTGSFFSTLLGVGSGIGNTIAAGVMTTVLGVTSVTGVAVVEELSTKDPGTLACAPDNTSVPERTQEYVQGGGEADLIRTENAGKLWSVYSAMGASKEQTAAVLGNLHHESGGLDPTATETIYDEPFMMGPKKMDALAKDYNVKAVAPSYAARFPAIKHMGIGLAQWTNDRNRLLIDFAKKKGVNWYEFDSQIQFMFAGDQPYRQKQLKDFLARTPGNIDAETEKFMNTWIGLSSPNNSLSHRKEAATDYMFKLETATADTNYAEGILSGINVDRSQGNAAAGAFHQDDGCGEPIKTHYRGKEVDGTGEVPAGLKLTAWTRETLPESLKGFAVDPELVGLSFGNSDGWAAGIIPDQCVALATSYFMQLYPDWNQGGRGGTRPFGNGKDTAPGWAKHYGESTTDVPSSGAVFSDKTTSVYGHTGIVQHVFANGDILVAEQNVRGASGAGAGLEYSWNWRVIKKDRYQQNNWVFFKPSGAEPQWTKGAGA